MEPLSSIAKFRNGSFHFPTRAPWESSKACHFYNTSKCLKGEACQFNHNPDDRSLRLVLDGPNICTNHLLGERGCEFSKKKGRKCWYSHDLTKAGLPLHDKELLRITLTMMEANILCKSVRFDVSPSTQELIETFMNSEMSLADFNAESDERNAQLVEESVDWITETRRRADIMLEQSRRGQPARYPFEGKPPAIDVAGMSGADILRACGVKRPFVAQQERKKAKSTFSTKFLDGTYNLDNVDELEDVDESSDGDDDGLGASAFGFDEDDMMELACQGVKPWDHDAADVLAMLSGGF